MEKIEPVLTSFFFFTYFSTTPSTVSGFYNFLNAVYARVLHSLINELIN